SEELVRARRVSFATIPGLVHCAQVLACQRVAYVAALLVERCRAGNVLGNAETRGVRACQDRAAACVSAVTTAPREFDRAGDIGLVRPVYREPKRRSFAARQVPPLARSAEEFPRPPQVLRDSIALAIHPRETSARAAVPSAAGDFDRRCLR